MRYDCLLRNLSVQVVCGFVHNLHFRLEIDVCCFGLRLRKRKLGKEPYKEREGQGERERERDKNTERERGQSKGCRFIWMNTDRLEACFTCSCPIVVAPSSWLLEMSSDKQPQVVHNYYWGTTERRGSWCPGGCRTWLNPWYKHAVCGDCALHIVEEHAKKKRRTEPAPSRSQSEQPPPDIGSEDVRPGS